MRRNTRMSSTAIFKRCSPNKRRTKANGLWHYRKLHPSCLYRQFIPEDIFCEERLIVQLKFIQGLSILSRMSNKGLGSNKE
ncbi:hypothetical protein H5410_004014 [Solanum commersonii]|uniref:Uncharacterized protein n=1 Tax=Solanum commersonii TaxID=4109 RepID=A0A9J6B6J8_SOLCO|nr:hypothetical protein H5410_004014 [Solanum commersonii]